MDLSALKTPVDSETVKENLVTTDSKMVNEIASISDAFLLSRHTAHVDSVIVNEY
jgi:hypothetical protein